MSVVDVLTPLAAELITRAVANVAAHKSAEAQEAAARRVLEASSIDMAADAAFHHAVAALKGAKKT